MKPLLLTTTLFIMTMTFAFSQDLSDYRWENRILLLLTDDVDNTEVKKQISEIRASLAELEERKLLTFLVTKDNSYMGPTFDEQVSDKSHYEKYKVTKAPFEVILIGLDGGVKSRYTGYQALNEIFGLIDGMPMRKAEMRKKGE